MVFPEDTEAKKLSDNGDDTSTLPLAPIFNSDISQVGEPEQLWEKGFMDIALELKNKTSGQMQQVKQRHHEEI